MISAIILVCFVDGECISIAPEYVFPTTELCEEVSQTIILGNLERVDAGEIMYHRAIYKCVNWGSES